MSLAEELRAAATKLRETAIGTTPAPWEDHSAEGTAWPILIAGGSIPGDPTGYRDLVIKVHESITDEVMTYADAAWIALASPALAEPLAVWLEKVATDHEISTKAGVGVVISPNNPALAVARAINGDPR